MTNQEMSELTVAVYDSDGVLVVELAGELDVISAAVLREALAAFDLDGGLNVGWI